MSDLLLSSIDTSLFYLVKEKYLYMYPTVKQIAENNPVSQLLLLKLEEDPRTGIFTVTYLDEDNEEVVEQMQAGLTMLQYCKVGYAKYLEYTELLIKKYSNI